MTVPNALTVLRILLIPVMVVLLIRESDVAAAIVFAVASATDFADGYLARRNRDVTTFGKAMDPVADKLLVIAALVVLVAQDRLAAWVAIVIVVREVAVTLARMQAPEVIAAAGWGKLKTALQVLALFFLILLDPSPTWVDVLVYAAVAATIISGVDFFRTLLQRDGAGGRSESSSHSRIEV